MTTTATRMLPAERRQQILAILRRRTALRVSTLSAELGVCEKTIRRDLARLAADGLVARAYGGALSRD
jgi:DeoR/GlpR family transcriptional regulator of sugar metabolism